MNKFCIMFPRFYRRALFTLRAIKIYHLVLLLARFFLIMDYVHSRRAFSNSFNAQLTVIMCIFCSALSRQKSKSADGVTPLNHVKGPYSERKSRSREEEERDRPRESTRARGCERVRD